MTNENQNSQGAACATDDALSAWHKKNLPLLRVANFAKSVYEGRVTIIIYAFPTSGKERELFDGIECAILHTWKILGQMKTVLIVSHAFDEAREFARAWPCVELKVSSTLIPGNMNSMSLDCITNLHTYFSTPHCLVIQNDGFPLQDTLANFLDRYDYIGAPAVRDSRRWFMRLFASVTLNGGFSLRSHKICANLARDWHRFWRFFFSIRSKHFFAEDGFYTMTARLNPFYRFAHKFPSDQEAFRFAYDDLGGIIAPPDEMPCGIHGHHTATRYLT